MDKKISFEAVIQKRGIQNGAYVEFPFSTKELYRKKGHIRVLAMVDGQGEYRGTLSPTATGFHSLNLTQAICRQVGKTIGDTVSVELWRDVDDRILEMPQDVQAVLKANPAAGKLFGKLAQSHQQEYIRWVTKAKKPETRENRKSKMVEMILAGKPKA